jgi:hypothetical protein
MRANKDKISQVKKCLAALVTCMCFQSSLLWAQDENTASTRTVPLLTQSKPWTVSQEFDPSLCPAHAQKNCRIDVSFPSSTGWTKAEQATLLPELHSSDPDLGFWDTNRYPASGPENEPSGLAIPYYYPGTIELLRFK